MKKIVITILLLLFTSSAFAKCYWMGYGNNYRCTDSRTGKTYDMYGKKGGGGYYKKERGTNKAQDCNWIGGKLICR